MAQGGQAGPDAIERIEIAIGHDHAGLVARLGQHQAPGVDDERATVAGPIRAVAPALGGREHECLILDCPGAQQDFPVISSGLGRERAGDGQPTGAARGQFSVELGEAHVVAP